MTSTPGPAAPLPSPLLVLDTAVTDGVGATVGGTTGAAVGAAVHASRTPATQQNPTSHGTTAAFDVL
jgi:hypothetical protein